MPCSYLRAVPGAKKGARQEVKIYEGGRPAQLQFVSFLAFSPDGQYLAVADGKADVVLVCVGCSDKGEKENWVVKLRLGQPPIAAAAAAAAPAGAAQALRVCALLHSSADAPPPALSAPASAVVLHSPHGLAFAVVDDSLRLCISDTARHRLLQLDVVNAVVSHLAGSNLCEAGFADGVASAARFSSPAGLAILVCGGESSLCVADTNNNRVRRLDLASGGVVSTLAGTGARGSHDAPAARATFNGVTAIAGTGSTLVTAEGEGHLVRITTRVDDGMVECLKLLGKLRTIFARRGTPMADRLRLADEVTDTLGGWEAEVAALNGVSVASAVNLTGYHGMPGGISRAAIRLAIETLAALAGEVATMDPACELEIFSLSTLRQENYFSQISGLSPGNGYSVQEFSVAFAKLWDIVQRCATCRHKLSARPDSWTCSGTGNWSAAVA